MHSSRRAVASLVAYRLAAGLLFVWHGTLVVLRRHDGLEHIGVPILSTTLFGLPCLICSLLAKVGWMAVASELLFYEVCHFLAGAIGIPLFVAFYQPLSPVLLARWVLGPLAMTTMFRAYISHLKMLFGLSTSSLMPHLLTLGPFYSAVLYRLATSEGIPAETANTLRICLISHGFNVLLHHHKVVGMEELIEELKGSLADRAVLLRSAFDATCHVRVLPPTEMGSTSLAGTLQVTDSSLEMDKLCCRAMTSEILSEHRVTSGLPALTEIVMRASDLKNNPTLNRTIVTLRDGRNFEIDCEVRAVASASSTEKGVICGWRSIGEKREVLEEENSAETGDELARVPALRTWNDEAQGSKPSLGERVLAALSQLWAALRAEPEPELLPATRAEFAALRCVARLLWVQCELTSLTIVKASHSAQEEFLAPVLGRTVPSLLVAALEAQKLRQALSKCRALRREDLASRGYYHEKFGVVSLRQAAGPSLPVGLTQRYPRGRTLSWADDQSVAG